jgi:hypothetical protein
MSRVIFPGVYLVAGTTRNLMSFTAGSAFPALDCASRVNT